MAAVNAVVARKSYLMRLVKRRSRLSWALLVLAAVAGLFVAWSGPAGAAFAGMILRLQLDDESVAQPSPHRVKICGPDQVCTGWATVEGRGVVNPFPEWRWQGQVTICVDDKSVLVNMPDQLMFDDSLAVDLSTESILDVYPWSLECQPATNGQQVEIELNEPDGPDTFGGGSVAARVCGTNQHGVPDVCTDLENIRGSVFAARDSWYVGAVHVTVTPSGAEPPVTRQFCAAKASEDRWAHLRWRLPSQLDCPDEVAPGK